MARRRKKKSKLQILTIIMAVLMAVIALAGIIVTIISGLLGE